MTARFRDTAFGQLVRYVSGNKVLQYPDEIDRSLWKRLLPQNASPLSTSSDKVSRENSRATDHEASNRIIENGRDVCLVDWYGKDDPKNPQNWPSSWKALVSFQMYILNFSVYIASSIYVPGEANIMEDFGVGEIVATLGLSLYTLGYGLGPMLWSPMSEIPKLGRSSIYLWTLLVFVLLQLPTGFAVNMPMFLFFRWLGGFFGSPSLVTGAATIGDMYDPARTAYGVVIWAAFGVCGPVFGPLLGGFVAPVKGWRWTIWIYTWACTFCLIMMFFLLPETSAANILYKRAKRLRKDTGDNRLRSQSEIDTADHTAKDYLAILGRAFLLLFTEPIVFLMDLYTALVYGVLFIWFESFPLVFGDIYGFDLGQQGLVYLGIFVGGVFTVPLYIIWVRYGVIPKFVKPGFKPEMLLPPTFVGSLALPICLFWYGWSAHESLPWIVPVIGSALFTIGVITLFNAVFNYLAIAYLPYSASVFAGNTLFRAAFGASFPLFARAMFERLGVGPGNSLLGGIATVFIPIALLLYFHGAKIRHMSKHARHDV